jgi:hypothetical protein
MKDKRSLHLKVQEMCDCFATSDPLKEMALLKNEPDKEEAATKWIALAILHGIDSHAKKISICKAKDGQVKVLAKYKTCALASPGPEIGNKIIETMKQITHIEEEKGKTPLAVGIRDSSIELKVKIEKEDDMEVITFKFPK